MNLTTLIERLGSIAKGFSLGTVLIQGIEISFLFFFRAAVAGDQKVDSLNPRV